MYMYGGVLLPLPQFDNSVKFPNGYPLTSTTHSLSVLTIDQLFLSEKSGEIRVAIGIGTRSIVQMCMFSLESKTA